MQAVVNALLTSGERNSNDSALLVREPRRACDFFVARACVLVEQSVLSQKREMIWIRPRCARERERAFLRTKFMNAADLSFFGAAFFVEDCHSRHFRLCRKLASLFPVEPLCPSRSGSSPLSSCFSSWRLFFRPRHLSRKESSQERAPRERRRRRGGDHRRPATMLLRLLLLLLLLLLLCSSLSPPSRPRPPSAAPPSAATRITASTLPSGSTTKTGPFTPSTRGVPSPGGRRTTPPPTSPAPRRGSRLCRRRARPSSSPRLSRPLRLRGSRRRPYFWKSPCRRTSTRRLSGWRSSPGPRRL